jgi:hypothetical protein
VTFIAAIIAATATATATATTTATAAIYQPDSHGRGNKSECPCAPYDF